jgi:hypothetical protein
MPEGMRRCAAVLLLALVAAGCGGDRPPPPRAQLIPSEVDGVRVSATVERAARGFVIAAEVQNRRDSSVALEPDPCGHAAAATIVWTGSPARGRTWDSRSVQRLKALLLERQTREDEAPPEALQADGGCEPRSAPVTLGAGEAVRERWTVRRSALLDEVGAAHAKVSVDVTEPGRHFPTAGAAGPLTGLVAWPATRRPVSAAQDFDRLLADPQLYRLLAAEPAGSWESAEITASGSAIRLTARSSRYTRPIVASGDRGGGRISIVTPQSPTGLPDGSETLS